MLHDMPTHNGFNNLLKEFHARHAPKWSISFGEDFASKEVVLVCVKSAVNKQVLEIEKSVIITMSVFDLRDANLWVDSNREKFYMKLRSALDFACNQPKWINGNGNAEIKQLTFN